MYNSWANPCLFAHKLLWLLYLCGLFTQAPYTDFYTLSSMKNLVFSLFVASILFSCKNSTSNQAGAADTPATPAELSIKPEQVKDANAQAQATLKKMEDFISELNAASHSVSDAKKEELNSIRDQISGVYEKQKMMSEGIAAALNAPAGGDGNSDLNGGAVPPPGVLKDYIESTSNYDKALEELKTQFEALKNK